MIVRLAIDMATYEYHDLTSEQLAAVRALLDGLSDCTVYPTDLLAQDDEFMMQSGKSYARMLEQKLTEKDNEIARLTRSRDDALAKLDNRALKQEIERLIAELDAARFAIPQPQPTQPLPPPVYVPVPLYVQPYPPAWLWPPYTISCTTAGDIKVPT